MDSVNNCCDEINHMDERVRMRAFSWIGGLLFAFGWWIFIDAVNIVKHNQDELPVKPQLYLLGVGTSISWLIIVCLDWTGLTADEFSHHGGDMVKIKTWALLLIALALALTCIILSIYVFSHVYAEKHGIDGLIPDDDYPGAAIIVQCLCLFFSSIFMRLGRGDSDY